MTPGFCLNPYPQPCCTVDVADLLVGRISGIKHGATGAGASAAAGQAGRWRRDIVLAMGLLEGADTGGMSTWGQQG